MLSPTAPAGFRPSGHGSLLVPLTTERAREVWSRDERKALERVAKLCALRGVRFLLTCGREGCRETIERVEDATGQLVLRCACSDRIMARNL